MIDCTNKKQNLLNEFYLLAILLLLAILTRAYGLSDRNITSDEIFTVKHAITRWKSFVNPASYALTVLSFKVFGLSEWSARLPNAIIGIFTIPIFYLTWKPLMGRNAALWGTLFLIFSSWHLWHSQYCRYYAGVFFFGSLSYAFLIYALRNGKLSHVVWSIVCNILCILFHATSAVIVLSCCTYAVIALWVFPNIKPIASEKPLKLYLAFYAIAGVVLLPFLFKVANTHHGIGTSWGYIHIKLILQTVKYLQLPIVIGTVFGLASTIKKDLSLTYFLGICLIIPALWLIGMSSIMDVRPDYIFYSVPLCFILSGCVAENVRQKLSGNGIIAYIIIGSTIAGLTPEMVSHYTSAKSLDVREAVQFVEKNFCEDDIILNFVPDFAYYGKKLPKEPCWAFPYDETVNWKEILRRYKNSSERLWIILPSNRNPLATELESWLLTNTSLVWRKHSKRYDYTYEGYQIFLTK